MRVRMIIPLVLAGAATAAAGCTNARQGDAPPTATAPPEEGTPVQGEPGESRSGDAADAPYESPYGLDALETRSGTLQQTDRAAAEVQRVIERAIRGEFNGGDAGAAAYDGGSMPADR